jgi:hypothetical protein
MAVVSAIVLLPWLGRLHLRPPAPLEHGRVARQLWNFRRGIRLIVTRNLWVLGMFSVLAWILWVAAVVVVASRVNLALPTLLLAMIVSLTEIFRLIPVSLQGIGIREGVFSMLVGLAGGSPESGFVAAAVAYAAMSAALAVSGAVGGLLGMASRWPGAGNAIRVKSLGER